MNSDYYFKRKGIVFVITTTFALLFLFFSFGFLVGFNVERPVSPAMVNMEKGKSNGDKAKTKTDKSKEQAKEQSSLALQTKLTPASPVFSEFDPPSALPNISPSRQ